jgi:hypothetical protein
MNALIQSSTQARRQLNDETKHSPLISPITALNTMPNTSSLIVSNPTQTDIIYRSPTFESQKSRKFVDPRASRSVPLNSAGGEAQKLRRTRRGETGPWIGWWNIFQQPRGNTGLRHSLTPPRLELRYYHKQSPNPPLKAGNCSLCHSLLGHQQRVPKYPISAHPSAILASPSIHDPRPHAHTPTFRLIPL